MGDLQMSGMAGRLVKVFDILTPLFMMVFFVMYLLEYDRRPISTEISEYLLFIISPNAWWIVRYVVNGSFLPFYFRRTVGERESSDSVKEVSNTKPGKLKYISVWFGCSISTTLISVLISTAARSDRRFFANNIEEILYGIVLLDWIFVCLIWVLAYNYFKSLDIRKVLPFIYLSLIFSILVEIGNADSAMYGEIGINPWNFVVLNGFFSVCFVVLFRFIFRRSGRI